MESSFNMISPSNMKKILLLLMVAFVMVFFVLLRHINLISDHINAAGDHLPNWLGLEGSALGAQYCSLIPRWTKSSRYPPLLSVASELGIKDGESVFVNGFRCGQWLLALQGTFPQMKLYGADRHAHFVDFVRTIVNGTFAVAEPWELTGLNFLDSNGKPVLAFDRALIDGVLSTYDAEVQCNVIRSMIPLVKPGGALYIGGHMEACVDSERLNNPGLPVEKSQSVSVVPPCFWPGQCLAKRHDIYEILYMNESMLISDVAERELFRNAYGDRPSKLKCASSVFIFKNILLLDKHKLDPLLRQSKYDVHRHGHRCTMAAMKSVSKHDVDWVHSHKAHIMKAMKMMKEKGIDMN